MYYSHNLYIPFSGIVKKLVLINVIIWFFLQVLIDGLILRTPFFTSILGLSTTHVFGSFFLWEPFTYMFLHSQSPWHIVFNMLLLWWLGAELERCWGSRFFLTYYLACGLGAGLIYLSANVFYSLFVQPTTPTVLIGASGAIYGLMLAYAIFFGNRVVFFMLLFPIKVKWLVTILGTIQFISLMQGGIHPDGDRVSYLAHLGGLFSGWIYLVVWTKYHTFKRSLQQKQKVPRKRKHTLKLIINRDDDDKDKTPKYWN